MLLWQYFRYKVLFFEASQIYDFRGSRGHYFVTTNYIQIYLFYFLNCDTIWDNHFFLQQSLMSELFLIWSLAS